jgi:probable rRNA maturation factor
MVSTVLIEMQNETSASSAPRTQWVQELVEDAVAAVRGSDGPECELSVRLVDEDEARSLNRQFREQDTATNVLSFPAELPFNLPADVPAALGDIVICGPLVEREASEQGKTAADHWGHLLVHGTLHLLGFDHQDNAQAEQMEALEVKILAARGINDPYRSITDSAAD